MVLRYWFVAQLSRMPMRQTGQSAVGAQSGARAKRVGIVTGDCLGRFEEKGLAQIPALFQRFDLLEFRQP